MKRVYHHFKDMEECQPEGMWRIVAGAAEREAFIVAAADLMRDLDAFRAAMFWVVEVWPNSCAAQMTTPSLNRRAWFGHAGCFIETRSPEDCTRLGWHRLTETEQTEANAAADDAIAQWEQTYARAGMDTLWGSVHA